MESDLDLPLLPLGCPEIRSLGSNRIGISTSKDPRTPSWLLPRSAVTAPWQTALSKAAFSSVLTISNNLIFPKHKYL